MSDIDSDIIYCADAIAIHARTGKHILVERLGKVKGLALSGGKQDPGELLSRTVTREFFEETGMVFVPSTVLGTFAKSGRDPRGRYVSTVFIGIAIGEPKDEAGKTIVHLYDPATFEATRHLFVFDHADIFARYLASV